MPVDEAYRDVLKSLKGTWIYRVTISNWAVSNLTKKKKYLLSLVIFLTLITSKCLSTFLYNLKESLLKISLLEVRDFCMW